MSRKKGAGFARRTPPPSLNLTVNCYQPKRHTIMKATTAQKAKIIRISQSVFFIFTTHLPLKSPSLLFSVFNLRSLSILLTNITNRPAICFTGLLQIHLTYPNSPMHPTPFAGWSPAHPQDSSFGGLKLARPSAIIGHSKRNHLHEGQSIHESRTRWL